MARNRGEEGEGDAIQGQEATFVDLTKLAEAVSNRTDTIESLAEDVLLLAESTAALTSEVRMVDYRRKEDRKASIIVYSMLTAMLIALSVGLIFLYNTSSGNNEILKEVRSCTTPSGPCAQRGAQSQGKAVNQLKMITLFAAECAVQHVKTPTDAIIQKCVEDKLDAAGIRTP